MESGVLGGGRKIMDGLDFCLGTTTTTDDDDDDDATDVSEAFRHSSFNSSYYYSYSSHYL